MAKIFQQSDRNPIGMVVSSLLTLAQFQVINGVGWVLADGSNIVGSTYATITGATAVPDLRGMVLRGKNNGRADGKQNPDGDLTLGVYQADAFQGHVHTVPTYSSTGANNVAARGANDVLDASTSLPVTDGVNGTPRTAAETRMRNQTVNHFIKINN
jgi:hypothetical protein